MNVLSTVLLGTGLGFLGSIPAAGPLAWLIALASAEGRRDRAFSLALGGALAESIYACLSFAGLGLIIARHPTLGSWFGLLGALLLSTLGSRLFFFNSPVAGERTAARQQPRRYESFATGFFLVLLNPAFAVAWVGFVGGASTLGWIEPKRFHAAAFAFGAWLGIFFWFSCVIWLLGRVKLSERTRSLLPKLVGAALVLVGIWLGVRVLATGSFR